MKDSDEKNRLFRQYHELMHVTGIDKDGNHVDPAHDATVNLAYGVSFVDIPIARPHRR